MRKLLLVFGSVLVALVIAETALRVAGLPRRYEPHTEVPQFRVLNELDGELPVYVNIPDSTVKFTYDSDPRGYFGPGNSVEHVINGAGFRGEDFLIRKPEGRFRIAFLGDSFTFGEGVRFEDTYPEVAARLLDRKPGPGLKVESLNFGVGGYNTVQELYALNRWAMPCSPDIVVLGHVLNDAEEPLVIRDPASGRAVRRTREVDLMESAGTPAPPDELLYRLRLARLVWQFDHARSQTESTIEYYRALYADGSAGWPASKSALESIAARCEEQDIPLYVIGFPILVELDRYPFSAEQEQVRRAAEEAGASFIDLLPQLRGWSASELWVHPTDQHPNEIVHRIAAERLAAAIVKDQAAARDQR